MLDSPSTLGVLYLIPVPIAADTHQQVLPAYTQAVLNRINYFVVENSRTARRYIRQIHPSCPVSAITFIQLDKHDSFQDMERVMGPLLQGMDMGVLSEAGCPGIADPGSMAVAYAHQHNIRVVPLVGPCSIFLALMASGFNGQHFVFHGYLPIKQQHRKGVIGKIEKVALETGQTQIFIETPYRNLSLFETLLEVCSPLTRLCIAKHLTASDGWVRSHTIQVWKSQRAAVDIHKTPVVFLLAP